MNNGFYIKKLVVSGLNKKAASIDFVKGLNVIAGASDTGKTFIFQCIDFMLGGQKPPKQIEESKGYEIVYLEIATYSDTTYTLQRKISGGPFQIKEGDINSNNAYDGYVEKLSNDTKNISTFLLTKSGLDQILLKKNKNNEKVRLSFRDVAGLCLIDEKQIITEDSPVYQTGQAIARTKEQSLFYYFLLGNDATELTEIEDPAILKNKIVGKIEFVKELIEKIQAELDEYKGQNLDEQEKALDELFEKSNIEYRTTIAQIDKMRNQKSEYFKNIEKLESKTLFNRELLERFGLLEKHYTSDKKRLEFISEGSFLLNQLNNVTCPICGNDLKDDHYQHIAQFNSHNQNFESALHIELEKITLKQLELVQTIAQLKEGVDKNNKAAAKIRAKIIAIDDSLNNSLTPVTKTLRERLQLISASKSNLDRYKNLKQSIDSYNSQLNALYVLSEKKNKAVADADTSQVKIFGNFTLMVEKVLTDWKFPNLGSVAFDNRHSIFDLVINGNPRSASGKGYRAITFSAFIYGLMKYCQSVQRNYPNFIVLDSPLTTFKAKDGVEEAKEMVGKDIEFAFFDSLTQLGTNEQVIILENKEPDLTLIHKMKYTHFSGQKNAGREGFFEN